MRAHPQGAVDHRDLAVCADRELVHQQPLGAAVEAAARIHAAGDESGRFELHAVRRRDRDREPEGRARAAQQFPRDHHPAASVDAEGREGRARVARRQRAGDLARRAEGAACVGGPQVNDGGGVERAAAALAVHEVQHAARVERELGRVRIAGRGGHAVRRAEAGAAVARQRDVDVARRVVAGGPGQGHRALAPERQGRRACGRGRRLARHAQRPGEAAPAVGGARDPQAPVVLGPGGKHAAAGRGGDVEASVVPDVAVDAALAVAFARARQVQRRGEGAAAVVRRGEEDLAPVRAAGEDDLLPERVEALAIVGRPGQARQPREAGRVARHVHRGAQRLARGRMALQQHGLAALVDPGHGQLAARAPRRGGIVHEVVARFVLLPWAAIAGAARNVHRRLPAQLGGAGGGGQQQQQPGGRLRASAPSRAAKGMGARIVGHCAGVHAVATGRAGPAGSPFCAHSIQYNGQWFCANRANCARPRARTHISA